ncbi:MAG: ABC transporter substrate-binding protein [Termitinemataceae bacterium]|nr:MAG: ABC transporter substrate-binding protein [Termitinemataceae bacterium]
MKKNFVKKTVVLICALLILFLAGCKAKKNNDGILIGISKITQHIALDSCETGIQDALKARGITASFDLQNANGDLSTAAGIAEKFKSEKVNVAVGIATPAAIAIANSIKDIPVVFTAVADPVGAELVKTEAHGDGNVTGVSDRVDTAGNIKLFKEIANIKTLGYIYTPAEANSKSEFELVKNAADENGIKLVSQTVNTTAEVKQAAQSIVARVDGLYMSTDNTVFSALSAVADVFNSKKKTIFAADASGAKNGGVMIAKGTNYYKIGLATGNMVADILEGKKPQDIPVKFAELSELDFLIDLDTADACGITIPQEYIDAATMIFKDGKLTEK